MYLIKTMLLHPCWATATWYINNHYESCCLVSPCHFSNKVEFLFRHSKFSAILHHEEKEFRKFNVLCVWALIECKFNKKKKNQQQKKQILVFTLPLAHRLESYLVWINTRPKDKPTTKQPWSSDREIMCGSNRTIRLEKNEIRELSNYYHKSTAQNLSPQCLQKTMR